MARSGIQKPGNVLAVVVFALITLLGLSLRNQKLDRIAAPPAAVQAAPTTDVIPFNNVQPAADDLSDSLWKAVGYTALVLGTIIGGAWLLKRYGGERLIQTSSPDIQVVGRKYLSPRQSLAIVKVRGKELLLGITDHSIQLVDHLDSDEE